YASRHGILDNTSRAHASHRLDLFAKQLQQAGCRTAHIGKWHIGNDPTPRPGYDYWVSLPGQGKVHNPDLFEDGRLHKVEGYITDIFTDRAVSFIADSEDSEKPFFLYVGHKTIHPMAVQLDDGTVDLSVPMDFVPADRHKGRYEGKKFERSPSVVDVSAMLHGKSNKPVLEEALKYRETLVDENPSWEAWTDPGVSEKTIQRRAEMMLSVDEGLGRIVETLKSIGKF